AATRSPETGWNPSAVTGTFGRPALNELQAAPPFVERKTPTSVPTKRSFGSVGSIARAEAGASGRLPEMFVHVAPAAVVGQTGRAGRPEKPPSVAIALRPSPESVLIFDTMSAGFAGRPAFRPVNVTPPSDENNTSPARVPIHIAPVPSPVTSSAVITLVVHVTC